MSSSTKATSAALLAFAIYQAAAISLFGMPLLHDFSHTFIGYQQSTDPSGYMWFLSWWPYAILNRLNPFLARVVWAPSGFNVTWAHCVPLPALLAAPITRAWGPMVSWNVLMLTAPVLAGLCAFILCRHLCGAFLPALIGGYLFGFSPYMLGHLLGHLSLVEIFPVPLALYLVVLRYEGRLSRRTFVALFGAAALAQFLCCHEVLFTAVVLGAIVALAAMVIFQPPARGLLAETCALAATGLALALVPLLPFLYYALFYQFPHFALNSAQEFSSDLMAFFVPQPLLLAGDPVPIRAIAERMRGGLAEDTAYIGIPMVLLVIEYGWKNRGNAMVRVMLVALAILATLSMGPMLHVEGTELFHLPWALFKKVPLLNQALPGRFMMFAFLDLALITALYLSSAPRSIHKWILVILTVISIIPNLPAGWWFSRTDTPEFFSTGDFRQQLRKDEITLVLPFGYRGNSMLWQAQTDMYFRMAGGSLGRTPPEFVRWPVLDTFYDQAPRFDFVRQMKFFLAAHEVTSIIVAPQAMQRWPGLLAPLNLPRSVVDDVIIYRVPTDLRAAYAGITVHDAVAWAAADAFAAMITAANSYWARNLPLSKLTPWEAARLDLLALPTNIEPTSSDSKWWHNLWLGEFADSSVGVGMFAQYGDLLGVVKAFGPDAKEIYFPYPKKLRSSTLKRREGQLLMVFDRDGLRRAAAQAAARQTAALEVKERR